MRISKPVIFAVSAELMLAIPAMAAPPKVTMASSGRRVVALTNLTSGEGCLPAVVKGKVVKRDFEPNGLFLSGVVIEEAGGERTFVNAGDNRGTDAATIGLVKQGLETMLRIGNRVTIGVMGCGAAGRVLKMKSLRLLK